jgi:hypothetical protein
MEKVFKILIVFILLMLVIVYSARVREKKFREYYFDKKIEGQGDGREATGAEEIDRPLLEAAGMQADDRENGLVFQLSEGAAITVSDRSGGRIITRIALEEKADSLVFDPSTRLIYSHSSEGVVTIIRQTDHDHYKIMQRLLVPRGYPDLLLDPQTGKIYLVAGSSALIYDHFSK